MYINKKLNHSHAFSFFSLFSFSAFLLSHVCFSTSLLRLLVAASLNKTLKSLIPHLRRNPQNPQSPAHPQTLRVRCTHNLKSEALLLLQSARRRRSLAYSLPIHIQISSALISNPTRQHFISSRTTRRHFFYSILNRWRHPQSSGSLFTYD